jgi:hypothetical protein
MKTLIFITCSFLSYFLYGFYISHYDPSFITNKIKNENHIGFYDYKGVINLHTHLSIGSLPSQTIIPAAKRAGLDFIIFSDLNNFSFQEQSDTYSNGVLALFAAKYSYLDSRLIYYSEKNSSLGASLGEAQVRLADFLSQKKESNYDSLLVLAHPYKSGFAWSGELPEGLDGFELLNLKSISNRSIENSFLNAFWSVFIYPFNSKLAFARLFAEPTDEVMLFDQISAKRKINMYAGSEASSRAVLIGNYSVKFPSYQRTFEFMSNHLLLKSELTGNISADRKKIFTALKKGHFYLALDIFGDSKGFISYIQDRNETYLMGEELNFNPNMKLKIKLPSVPKDFFEVIILRNGEKWRIANQDQVELTLPGPGVYRVQVRVSPFWPIPDARKWVTWIYTNAFFVK